MGRFLRRVPVGWLQLVHNPSRLLAASAGVSFANILILMQLGFLGALVAGIKIPYDQLAGDVLISSTEMNTLADGNPIPRQRMFQALSVEGVSSAVPIHYGKLAWRQADGSTRNLDVLGVPPTAKVFNNPELIEQQQYLARSDVGLVDRKTRNVAASVFATISPATPHRTELNGRSIDFIGTFSMGGSFAADGYLVVSDQTFLRLFPTRLPGAPNHVLVRTTGQIPASPTHNALQSTVSPVDAKVQVLSEAARLDQAYQTTQKPIGLVFGFGVFIGVIVGVIILYQVLSTDVADHMREYATLKAIGYRHRFFVGVIIEEATILGLIGFIPGLLVSLLFYKLVGSATDLPMAMSWGRGVAVLFGTVAVSILSGVLATRRLTNANPADLF